MTTSSHSGPAEIAPALAFELATDLRHIIAKLRRKLREQGNLGDVTDSQRTALLRLEREGPMTVSALARAEGMRSQSMGAIVAALEAAGQVSGSPDPSDGRQTLLSVTPAFQASLDAGRAARQDWLSHIIQDKLGMDEQQELARAVALLKRLAEP